MLLIYSLIFWTLIDAALSFNETTLSDYLLMEGKLIGQLEGYIDNQESVLQMLRKKLLTYKVEHAEAVENPEQYFDSKNELNKFLFIKRLSSDINLMAAKTVEVANKFKSVITEFSEMGMLPTTEDLRKSTMMIAQMQNRHKLRPDKIAKGFYNIGSEQRRAILSTEDCYQIGKQLNSVGLYEPASDWLKEASRRYNEYYDLHQITSVEILEQLAISFINLNQERQASDVVGRILRIDSNNQITAYMKHKRRTNAVAMTTTFIDLCRPAQLLSFLTFTCPI